MLRSLLHYQSSTLLASLVALISVVLGLDAHSDSLSTVHPRVMVMNVGTLSSTNLEADAGYLNQANNPLDEAEIGQRLMNAQWLEASSKDESDYYEGGDALEELAEEALKYYWHALVERDRRYNRYTPVVEGNLSRQRGNAEYGIRLSGDTLKFRVGYTF